MIMRETCLSSAYLEIFLGYKPKILFFMGLAGSATAQQQVQYESQTYGDIIQSNFVDSYKNNTYKAMLFLL